MYCFLYVVLFCFYNRDNIWTILSGQTSDHTSSIAIHDVKEIETWILRLLSSPVPIPGSTRLECELIAPLIREPLLFALPDHTRFSLVDFPLHLPLELLGKLFGLGPEFHIHKNQYQLCHTYSANILCSNSLLLDLSFQASIHV